MPFDAPFKLGPFSVDAEGRLSPTQSGTGPNFRFRWHGRAVCVQFDHAPPGEGRLKYRVALARVRSTACCSDATLRPRCFAVVRRLERVVPSDWRVALLVDHRIWLETETPIGVPITATGLVTELTRFALELAP